MRLHSPQFEKAVHRGVRRMIRVSPELKRECRAARTLRRHYSITPLAAALIALAPGYLVWTMQDETSHPETALAFISLWGFALMIFRAQAVLSCLFASSDLRTLILLPISESTVFRWEFQRFLRGSLVHLLHFAAGFSVLAWLLDFSALKWTVVPLLALLTWAVMISMATLCAARLPWLPYRLLVNGFVVLIFAFIVGRTYIGPVLLEVVDRHASSLNLLLPTGWPVSLFELLLPNSHWAYLVLLIPIAAVIMTFNGSLRRLAGGYRYQERAIPPASDLVPHTETPTPISQDRDPERPFRLGPTAIEEVIRSRQFLMPFPWQNAGWLENLLWRWLSDREKVLADFVFPNGLRISASWKTIFRNLGVALLLALVADLVSPAAKFWLLAIGLFITICHVLAVFLATGRAFQVTISSGIGIPMYAGLGIGLRELSVFLVKCSTVQLPFVFPFAILCSTMVVWQTGMPLQFGFWFGLKIGVLLLAGRFLTLTFGISGGTNDTARIRFRSAGLIISMAFFMLAFLGLCAASLFIPDQRIALPLLALTVAEAYATFRLYGWFYNGNRFDLMRLPQR